MNLYEKLNRLDDKLVESKRVIKKKKLTEGVFNKYEINGKEVTWPEYFEYNMETNDYLNTEDRILMLPFKISLSFEMSTPL